MRYRSILPFILVAAGLALPASPAGAQDPLTPAPVVAPAGSTIAGVDVSGQDAATAIATLQAAYAQPILIRIGERTFRVTTEQVDAKYHLKAAVDAAVVRTEAGNTPVEVSYSTPKLQATVDRIVRQSGNRGEDAHWVLRRVRPVVDPGSAGDAPRRATVLRQVRRAIELPLLRPQQDVIPLEPVKPDATLKALGYVVVISKPSRTLMLYAPVKGKAKVVRHYRVAVGAPSFPTPSGRFTIVDKQVDPWWYPPSSDWAKGEEPVPPGPGNPLGTRWMGLDRQDVGIHGTPDSGSIGGYASHGCVRMLIDQAEALYALVDEGTPVIIY